MAEYRIWLPLILTVFIWLLAVFGIAEFVSKTWADLIGLFYLAASPIIYRSVKSIVPEASGQRSTDHTTT